MPRLRRDPTNALSQGNEAEASTAALLAELNVTRQLQEVSIRLIEAENVSALYEEIADAALVTLNADFASVQRLERTRGHGGKLLLLANRGFTAEAAEFFKWVSPSSPTSCGSALATGKRAVIPDVEECSETADSKSIAMSRRAGIRAMQTTPLVSRRGVMLGAFSTHWRAPHVLSLLEARSLDVLARLAADLIERWVSEEREERLAREIQLRTEAEAAKEQLRFVTERAEVGTWYWDADSGSMEWSPICKRLFGLREDEKVSHKRFLAAIHPDDRRRTEEAFRACLNSGGRIDYDIDYRVGSSDGPPRWVRAKGSATFVDGKPVRMAGIAIDSTDRKRAEDALRLDEERLRTTAVLEERARIARDLHDTLAQGFTGIVLNLEGAEESSNSLPMEVRSRIARAKEVARTNLEEARRSILSLAPPNRDLTTSLREVVDRCNSNRRTPVELSFSDAPVVLRPDVTEELIHIIQQSVDNAEQHARAKTIRLEVAFGQKQVRIRIRDDGRGFEISQSNHRFGLKNMHERAAKIGATFELTSRPGKGTEIVVTVPQVSATMGGRPPQATTTRSRPSALAR